MVNKQAKWFTSRTVGGTELTSRLKNLQTNWMNCYTSRLNGLQCKVVKLVTTKGEVQHNLQLTWESPVSCKHVWQPFSCVASVDGMTRMSPRPRWGAKSFLDIELKAVLSSWSPCFILILSMEAIDQSNHWPCGTKPFRAYVGPTWPHSQLLCLQYENPREGLVGLATWYILQYISGWRSVVTFTFTFSTRLPWNKDDTEMGDCMRQIGKPVNFSHTSDV